MVQTELGPDNGTRTPVVEVELVVPFELVKTPACSAAKYSDADAELPRLTTAPARTPAAAATCWV